MHNPEPSVSVGLPVYNRVRFVGEALDSFLDQTYQDFELILSDNGSTDGTDEICREYEAKDARIRYYRSEENLGAGWNFNNVFHLSNGKYFKWAASDDMCAPTYLEKCVAVLENQPEVVLCHSWLVDIDESAEEIRVRKSFAPSDLQEPHKRFWHLAMVHPAHSCEEIFGVIRRDVLAKTRLIRSYADSDRTLLAELGLYGPFHEIPEPIFLHRMHTESSVEIKPSRHERMSWFDPKHKGRILLPSWMQYADLLSVVRAAPISPLERTYCYLSLLRWFKRRRVDLFQDLVKAANALRRRNR